MPSLQFGTCYFGETRDIQVMLVNDGPEPTKVASLVPKQDSKENEAPYWSFLPVILCGRSCLCARSHTRTQAR